MSRDLTVERIRQAALHGEGITLDALEVVDLHQELNRLMGVRAVPYRTGRERLTGELLIDLGRVLERHHYQRAEGPGPMADFAVAAASLARAFEGQAQ